MESKTKIQSKLINISNKLMALRSKNNFRSPLDSELKEIIKEVHNIELILRNDKLDNILDKLSEMESLIYHIIYENNSNK